MRATGYTFIIFYVAYGQPVNATQGTSNIFVFDYFVSSLYLPDLIMVISFAMLSWVLFVLFQLSSMNKESFSLIHTRI